MSTLQSPRVENGTIKWYEGDAFFLNFSMRYKGGEEEISLGENDKFVINFYQNCNRPLWSAEIHEMVGSFYPIHIDSRVTRIFGVGKYHYDIELHKNNSETIQTILKCGKIEVEGCNQCQM